MKTCFMSGPRRPTTCVPGVRPSRNTRVALPDFYFDAIKDAQLVGDGVRGATIGGEIDGRCCTRIPRMRGGVCSDC